MVLTYTPLRRQQHNTIKANDYALGLLSMQRLLYLLERTKERKRKRNWRQMRQIECRKKELANERKRENNKRGRLSLFSFYNMTHSIFLSLFQTRVRTLLSSICINLYPAVLSMIIIWCFSTFFFLIPIRTTFDLWQERAR